jgi:hypothetical protein
MGKIMEAVFCAAYLIVTAALGVNILKTANADKLRLRFGALTLVLVGGGIHSYMPLTSRPDAASPYACFRKTTGFQPIR